MSDEKSTIGTPLSFCRVCGLAIDRNQKKTYWDNGFICSAACRAKLTRTTKALREAALDKPEFDMNDGDGPADMSGPVGHKA